jgi:hypothetical protein
VVTKRGSGDPANGVRGAAPPGLPVRRVGLVLLSALVAVLLAGCRPDSPQQPPAVVASSPPHEDLRPQIVAFCGACHVTPEPAHYPREAWREEVEQGYNLFYASSLTGLKIPPREKVVAYYESRAPENIEPPPASRGVDPGGFRFRRADLGTAAVANVAHVNWLPGGDGQTQRLVICDMGTGEVQSVVFDGTTPHIRTLAKLEHPAHAEHCDLDNDGVAELVIADLGSYAPSDHDRGRVVWLRANRNGTANEESHEVVVLQDKLPRVADVQPVDYDQDGDQDLVVAAFGWRQTGELRLLENGGVSGGGAGGVPRFTSHTVDSRHGTIHVPPQDWNGDGRLDFAALISQEHEVVELFLNDGTWQPRVGRVFAADRPSFGSSGIALADLNADGRTDILYTNGDMFDDYYLRDYHAVHWLENLGSTWRTHELARMPGVLRAVAADFDLDGDLDVVACALLPKNVLRSGGSRALDSLILLEQTAPGEFVRRVLEVENCRHATLCVGDFDADGDPDLAVGNYSTDGESDQPPLQLWWNLCREPRSSPQGEVRE